MIHCKQDNLYHPRYVTLWSILSMKAGFLNAIGFLATGYFVSHITGFGTQVGVTLAHEEYLFGFELLLIPFSFILGASIPAYILDRNYDKNRIPPYPIVQIMITATLGIILAIKLGKGLGHTKTDDVILIALLCLTCGMKNGLTTWATFGKIRTTHLTGLATDIGLHLPELFARKKRPYRYPEGKKINTVRIITLISFSLGSLIAAFAFPIMEFKSLIIPFVVSLILAIISIGNYRYNIRLLKTKPA